jgi:hypothetical protein
MEEQGHLDRATLVVIKIVLGMPEVEVEVLVLLVNLHQLIMLEVLVVQDQLLQLRVHLSTGVVVAVGLCILVLVIRLVVMAVVVMAVQRLVELRAVTLVRLEQQTRAVVEVEETTMGVTVRVRLVGQVLSLSDININRIKT